MDAEYTLLDTADDTLRTLLSRAADANNNAGDLAMLLNSVGGIRAGLVYEQQQTAQLKLMEKELNNNGR